jgi:hypothetical protein
MSMALCPRISAEQGARVLVLSLQSYIDAFEQPQIEHEQDNLNGLVDSQH